MVVGGKSPLAAVGPTIGRDGWTIVAWQSVRGRRRPVSRLPRCGSRRGCTAMGCSKRDASPCARRRARSSWRSSRSASDLSCGAAGFWGRAVPVWEGASVGAGGIAVAASVTLIAASVSYQLAARDPRQAWLKDRHALPPSVDDLGAGDLARRGVRNGPVDAVPCGVADLARGCRRHADGDHDRRPGGRRLRLHRIHARRTCHRDPARAAAVRRRGDRLHGECRDDARRRLVPAPLQRARRSRAASRRRSSTPRSSWRAA